MFKDNQSDVYICGVKDRNRALNGDVVVVSLCPRQEWKVCSVMLGKPAPDLSPPSTSVSSDLWCYVNVFFKLYLLHYLVEGLSWWDWPTVVLQCLTLLVGSSDL